MFPGLEKKDLLPRAGNFNLFPGTPLTRVQNSMVLVRGGLTCTGGRYASNFRPIVGSTRNQLFFKVRPDAERDFWLSRLNPKPEHPVYRDVLSGFYGEYLEDTPGVRETVTVFGNCSDQSEMQGPAAAGSFGASSIVIGPHHNLPHARGEEYSTDDFGGAPLWRMRFGTQTRLFYVNLPFDHEVDPRGSRVPLKVHALMRPTADGRWVAVRRGDRAREDDRGRQAVAEPIALTSLEAIGRLP